MSSQQVDVLPSDLDELKQRVRLFQDHHQELVNRVRVYLARVHMLFEQALREAQQQVEECRAQLAEIEQHNRMAQRRDDFQPTANTVRRSEQAEHHLSRLRLSEQQIDDAARCYISQSQRLDMILNTTTGTLQSKLNQLRAFQSIQFEQELLSVNPLVQQPHSHSTDNVSLDTGVPHRLTRKDELPTHPQPEEPIEALFEATEAPETESPVLMFAEQAELIVRQSFLQIFHSFRHLDWEKALLIASAIVSGTLWVADFIGLPGEMPLLLQSSPAVQQEMVCSTSSTDQIVAPSVPSEVEMLADSLGKDIEDRVDVAKERDERQRRAEYMGLDTSPHPVSSGTDPIHDLPDQSPVAETSYLPPGQSGMHLVAVAALPDPEGSTGATDSG